VDDSVPIVVTAPHEALHRIFQHEPELLARALAKVGMVAMNYGFQSQLHREWRAEGRVQEAAAAVLRVLKARGLAVPEEVAKRINDCTDHALLEDLQIRAVTVEDAWDLFA
jgi:hypothetical protein